MTTYNETDAIVHATLKELGIANYYRTIENEL